jgi:hypothetical protein
VSVPHHYTQDLAGIQAPVLLIHGRYDRMVLFELSIAILNHIADWHPRAAQQLRAMAALREAGDGPRRSLRSCRAIEREG